eukprot:gene1070-777_t
MNLNFYHFSASFKGCILLAGPGTVLQTFGVATVAYFVLPYKWNWTVCLIFGAITAATDPVAVVALLKEYGASKRLMYLIVGESLLNDGAALALYVMFFDWISKSQSNWSARRTIIYVVQVVALSPAIGIAFGLSTLALLRLLNKRMHAADSIMQISLTICCAYLSFYVAQHTLEISGALACCGAGLVLSRFGHPLLIRAESLIIGSGAISFFHGLDLAYILLMYTAVLLVRTCIVALFYPFLSSMGAGCSWREAMFLAFSGLRGSVCVALALSLVHSATGKAALLEVDRARSVFLLSGGVAACTLLFNGTLAGAVLRCLRLSPEGPHQKVFIMQQYVRKRIRLKSLTLLEHLQAKYPDSVNPSVVWKNSIDYAVELSHTSGLDDWGFILQQHPHLFEGLHSSVVDDNEEAGLLGEGIDEESKLPGLADNDDAWPSNTRSTYPPFTDTPDDNSHIRIGRQLHFDSVTNFFAPSTQTTTSHVEPVLPRVETSSQKNDCGRRGGDPYLLYCHAQAVYLLVAFIEAHEYAEEKIRFYVGSAEGVQTTDEEIVVEESRALVRLAKYHLYRIDRDIITCQLTKQAARMILHAQEDAITEFSEEGVITGHDAMMMLEEVYRDKALLAKYRKDSFSMAANGDLQTSTAPFRALYVCYYRLQRWVHNLWRRMTTAAAVGRCGASTECVPVGPSSSGP